MDLWNHSYLINVILSEAKTSLIISEVGRTSRDVSLRST